MGSIADYLAMNSTAHTVMQFDKEFRKHISVEDTCFRCVPDNSDLYSVPNDGLLNGLVLGHAPGAVCAANWLHMAVALFGASFFQSEYGKKNILLKRGATYLASTLSGQ